MNLLPELLDLHAKSYTKKIKENKTMCDTMTSHLYHITNGATVYALWSHSFTRYALNIDDKDESYAEVEWKENETEPEIRFPDSWRQSNKDICNTFYSKFNSPDDLIKFLLPLAVGIILKSGKEKLIPKKLSKCKYLNCAYTEITVLPELPKCKELDCSYTKITKLPDLPKCQELDCSYTKITELPDLPECTGLISHNTKMEVELNPV
jgi:Leucine-rich repeat (LRR) protein